MTFSHFLWSFLLLSRLPSQTDRPAFHLMSSAYVLLVEQEYDMDSVKRTAVDMYRMSFGGEDVQVNLSILNVLAETGAPAPVLQFSQAITGSGA